jgi:hypothetical protein
MSESPDQLFALPATLIGKSELAQLIREVEAIDLDLETQKARGATSYQIPAISAMLNDFLTLNKVDIIDPKHRLLFRKQLNIVKKKAPVIHLTFASKADPQSLQELVYWIRVNIYPVALVSVGLQPGLIGGVYIRTPNHVIDLSIRGLLQNKTDVIVKDLQGLIGAAG